MYFNQHETHYNIFPSNIYLFLISQVVAQDGDRTNNELQKDLGKCTNFKPRSGHDAEEMHNFVDNLNFEDVQRYVMFLSFARAGHSWIGSVLDAAPNALVANEYDTISTFMKNRRNMTQDMLFKELAKNSFLCGKYGRIQVYNYSIPGLWQGKLGDGKTIEVIGDKKGGITMVLLSSFGKPWKDKHAAEALEKFLQDFRDFVKVPLRVVIVLRNPFDIIATQHLRSGRKRIDSILLLNRYERIMWVSENLFEPKEVHVMTMESFASDTERELKLLCEFVGIQCPSNMIQKVNNLTHHTPHSTYGLVEWRKDQVMEINRFIVTYLSTYGYRPMYSGV